MNQDTNDLHDAAHRSRGDHGDYHDELDAEKSFKLRSIGTILAVVIVIGGFITLCWYAYNFNSKPAAMNEVPVIKADNNAVKIKPDDPGGMVVPNMDKTVYDNFSGNGNNNLPKVERLLPAPEEPVDKSKIAANDHAAPAPSKPADQPTNAGDASQQESEGETSAEAAGATEKKAVASNNARKPISPSDIKPVPADEKTKTAENLSNSKHALTGYKIQLASFKTEKEAEKSWPMLKKAHAPLLDKLEYAIERKNLGSKGVYYRLQAGPISTESEARLLCKKLIEVKQGCIVVGK